MGDYPVPGCAAGRGAGRPIGERPLIVVGLLLETAGMAWIAVISGPGMAYPAMIAPMVISGCGFAMAIPAVTKSVVSPVAPRDIGKASGTFSTMRQLGGAFGIAIGVAVFAAAGSYASPRAFSDGFVPAMGVAAGLALAGFVAALVLPRRRTADGPVVGNRSAGRWTRARRPMARRPARSAPDRATGTAGVQHALGVAMTGRNPGLMV